MENELRIVSGGHWTTDGRWVVVGPWVEGGLDCILFDSDPGYRLEPDDTLMLLVGLQDCIDFVKEKEQEVIE